MQKENCFHLGKITKPHGLKGEVQIWLDVDEPNNYKKLKTVILETKLAFEEHEIEQIQIRGKKSILKLKGLKKIEDTETIIGAELYLPLNKLPKLKDKQFYYHEVINYQIIDQNQKLIGTLKSIYESTGQDLFAINLDEKEILIPIVDEFIVSIDHDKKEINLNIPEGLIDVFIS